MTAIWWITLSFATTISMLFTAPVTQVSHTFTSAEKRTNRCFVVQAVSCWPVTAKARVQARATLCGIFGEAGFSPRTSAFLLSNIMASTLRTIHSLITDAKDNILK